jgi:hypothetical protein
MALYDPTPERTHAQEALHSFLTDTAWTMRAAKKLGITHLQVGNFAVLASYLRKLPENYRKFDMSNFYVDGTTRWKPANAVNISECGTTACAAGHGPVAGVAALPNESWGHYIQRAFCEFGGTVYSAAFSEYWAPVDNSARGAAARILFMLDNPGRIADLAHNSDVELYQDYLA